MVATCLLVICFLCVLVSYYDYGKSRMRPLRREQFIQGGELISRNSPI